MGTVTESVGKRKNEEPESSNINIQGGNTNDFVIWIRNMECYTTYVNKIREFSPMMCSTYYGAAYTTKRRWNMGIPTHKRNF
jgi:hypothetical protein